MMSLVQEEILWEALWLMSGEWGKLWESKCFNKKAVSVEDWSSSYSSVTRTRGTFGKLPTFSESWFLTVNPFLMDFCED